MFINPSFGSLVHIHLSVFTCRINGNALLCFHLRIVIEFLTLFCFPYRNPGHCKELLLLCFSDCIIGRYVEATIVTKEESLIAASKPFSPQNVQKVPVTEYRKTTVIFPDIKR